ncbi:proline/betaine transporter-like protein [Rickettsia conorii str. Malish 7]|uniref:Proline/betaine transporter-like protein n=2 Tax=Rickettsia conorii TaxID=781 RepID=Q92G04_RICCN|nr:proline/betaine transporter-like protein [Rickettsia conorii str. Malish 7]
MRKVVISGMIGNALEWYDYALYAQFAYIIGQHFSGSRNARDVNFCGICCRLCSTTARRYYFR